jgi:acetyl-CoA synthetase
MKYIDFWHKEAEGLSWTKPFTQVHDGRFACGEWFKNGTLNASFNCLDRHVHAGRGDSTAIIFESEQAQTRHINYRELLELTCDIATILYNQGIRQGDRIAIYMPLIPEAIASMLACARLGAIHTVIFGGFAQEALAERIFDCEAKAVITAQSSQRKGQILELEKTVNKALLDPRTKSVKSVLCFGKKAQFTSDITTYFSKPAHIAACVKNPESFEANHPLFILYTSGTTGKPKGIFHATGGYLTHTLSTTKHVFNLTDEDLFWCTADVGWITGHSYVAYGPLAQGARIFIYEGALNYPSASRIYELIDKHHVSVLYTAPTAIRMFMQAGESHKNGKNLQRLRLLGSVGEPINPEAWRWYSRVFGADRCPIVDTWWQTETGGMMITPRPHSSVKTSQKPGSAEKPFFVIEAQIVDENGQNCKPDEQGFLVIKQPWPGLARGIWGDEPRFIDTYFAKMPGVYFTGDGARVDHDGDFFISGRIDDVVNVAGHRLGTAEVESALVAHEAVAEAAVVGVPDEVLGQKLVAFVTLRSGFSASEQLSLALKEQVKTIIGSFAKPALVNFVSVLPKTRSGKIMRRLLRSLAAGEEITTDISTLEDESSLFNLKSS